MKKIIPSVVVLLTMTMGLMAQSKETVITSRKMDFDYKRLIVEFTGDVVVIDPQMRIESDNLTVLFNSTNEVKSVTASGNVRIKLPDKTGTADKSVYTAKDGKIVLTGNAKVVMRGKDSVKGDEIDIWVNEERMVSKPATMSITPDEKSGGGGLGGMLDFGQGNKDAKQH